MALTPLHHWHAAHGATFADWDGWQVPVKYDQHKSEEANPSERLAIADLSAFAKLSLFGAGLDHVRPSGESPVAVGSVLNLVMKPEIHLCRLRSDHMLVLAMTTQTDALDHFVKASSQLSALVRQDATSVLALFALIGNDFEKVLSRLMPIDVSLRSFPAGACKETSLGGVHSLLIRPSDQVLPTMYIGTNWDYGEFCWARIMDAGNEFGIALLGLDSWPTKVEGNGCKPRRS